MGNMTLFIAGIAILSLGTYLMRLGGAKARQSAGIFRALAGAAFRCGDGAAFFRRPATTFYEGAHFAGMARVLGVAFAVFLAAQGPADRRDYRRRRGDRAAAPGGYALGRVSVICKTAVLPGDRAFKPLNNRFDLQRVPLVYRQYRS